MKLIVYQLFSMLLQTKVKHIVEHDPLDDHKLKQSLHNLYFQHFQQFVLINDFQSLNKYVTIWDLQFEEYHLHILLNKSNYTCKLSSCWMLLWLLLFLHQDELNNERWLER